MLVEVSPFPLKLCAASMDSNEEKVEYWRGRAFRLFLPPNATGGGCIGDAESFRIVGSLLLPLDELSPAVGMNKSFPSGNVDKRCFPESPMATIPRLPPLGEGLDPFR